MPNFEVFQRKNARVSREPTLTITVRGTLNLNEPAFNALGKPEAVVLLYARAERIIGLRPAGKDEADAYLVRPSGTKGRTRMTVAREFCAWVETDRPGSVLRASRRYALTVGPDGIGCADLSGPSQVVSGNRNRASADRRP